MTVRIIHADVLEGLAQLDSDSVHCVVTSPPYYGLRDYGTGTWEGGDAECEHVERTAAEIHKSSTLGPKRDGLKPDNAAFKSLERQFRETCGHCGARRVDGQLGLEPTLAEHIDRLVEVFEEVRRVLRPDGVCFLNYGDAYNAYNGGAGPSSKLSKTQSAQRPQLVTGHGLNEKTLKPKDLMLIPERLSIALQEAGWWVRDRIVWHKPNPMPSSVTDRCTPSYELVYMLVKNGDKPQFWTHERGKGGSRTRPEPDYLWTHRETGEERTTQPDDDAYKPQWTRRNLWRSSAYWWDAEAIKEPSEYPDDDRKARSRPNQKRMSTDKIAGVHPGSATYPMRNARNVWTIATHPMPEAHFATFPPELVRRCLLAACPERVCADCGAGWVREVERGELTPLTPADANRVGKQQRRGDGRRDPAQRTDTPPDRHYYPTKTLGWHPSCTCQAETRRGVALDCFGGSGTVGLVADQMNRDAILIELSADYCDMARRRIEGDAPLFSEVNLTDCAKDVNPLT